MIEGGRWKRATCASTFLLLAVLCSANESIPLQLDEAIALALENNIELELHRESRTAAKVNVLQAKAAFDPSLNAGYSLSEDQRPLDAESSLAANGLTLARTESDQANLGISGNTPLSTSYSLSANNRSSADTFNEFQEEHASSASLSLSQPLLRGRGHKYVTYGVRIARRNLDISDADFYMQTQQMLLEVENAYWDLLSTQQTLEVRKKSIEAATSLLEQVQAQLDVGTASNADLIQAQSGLAQRNLAHLTARRAYSQQNRNLKNLIEPDLGLTDIQFVPIDRPSTNQTPPTVEWAMDRAHGYRLEFVRWNRENSNAEEALARIKNDRLPQLDLEGSYGVNGLGGTFGDAFSEARTQDQNNWTIGLVYRRPWPGRANKAELLQQQSALRTLGLQHTQIRQRITSEIADVYDRMEGAREQLAVGKLALKFAQLNLENEHTKFEVQKSTVHNILQIETELLEAKLSQVQARIEWQKILAEIKLTHGGLLEHWGLGHDFDLPYDWHD